MTNPKQAEAVSTTELDKKIDQMLTWDINGKKEPVLFRPEIKQAINKLISEEVVKELGKIGFDKRLDNPLLYCEGNDAIPLDEAIRKLRGDIEL